MNQALLSTRDKARASQAAATLASLAEQADTRGLKHLALEATLARAEALLTMGQHANAAADAQRALTRADNFGMRMLQARAHHVAARAAQALQQRGVIRPAAFRRDEADPRRDGAGEPARRLEAPGRRERDARRRRESGGIANSRAILRSVTHIPWTYWRCGGQKYLLPPCRFFIPRFPVAGEFRSLLRERAKLRPTGEWPTDRAATRPP